MGAMGRVEVMWQVRRTCTLMEPTPVILERIIEEDKFMVSCFRCIVKNTYWKIHRVLK